MGQSGWAGRLRDLRATCIHEEITRSTTAGIERAVCALCGHVSIGFVGEVVQLHPDKPGAAERPGGTADIIVDVTTSRPANKYTCSRCEETAFFYTPQGLACPDHAWASVEDQDLDSEYFWIPLPLNR